MAKQEVVCPICSAGACKLCAIVAIIIGVCFILQDRGIWDFWNLSWYTIGFLIIGLGSLIGMRKK